MTKYTIIIGDVHGRVNWRQLVYPLRDDCTYVFLGDFSDPYYSIEEVTFEQMFSEMESIFKMKQEHPDNVIILLGNHDLQYIIKYGETSRYELNVEKKNILFKFFEENLKYTDGVAYQINNKYLITHAGVTKEWYEKHFGEFKKDTPLEDVVKNINELWEKNKSAFCFCGKFSDYYGISESQGPLWIRPETLWYANLFGFDSGIIQVVGHTPYESDLPGLEPNDDNRIATIGTVKIPADKEKIENGLYFNDGINICQRIDNNSFDIDIILADCLRRETACVEINNETLTWRKIYLGDVENSKIKW